MELLVVSNDCSSPVLGSLLSVLRDGLNIIGIAVPILLIVRVSIQLFQMIN